MISRQVSIQTWWYSLNSEWQKLMVDNLELEGCFSELDLEYVMTITELDLCGSGITDLSPVRQLVNLESLDISGTRITDISPILDLPVLREFSATFCCELNLEILEQMKGLEVLDLSYPKELQTRLPDFGLMKGLKEIYCNACGLKSVIPFMSGDNLEVVCAFFNPIPEEELKAYRELSPGCKVLF